ncbi:hypothetical protein GQ44DRAFT_63715 [Phaeosphaeriaceae sp. PMI808]|nr:hypothetical protein GQ44DRAFT_63715 [Phaeosphaeriaceae sp. PMI808]
MQVVSTMPSREYGIPQMTLPLSVVLPTDLCRAAYGEKSMEAFADLYIPRGGRINVEGKLLLEMMPRFSVDDEALRLAVLAIGTVALGKQINDTDLTRHGQNLYGKALTETRIALQNPIRARSIAVLVIPRVMALFEILFGAERQSPKQAQSWLSHAEGENALILARGPEAYTEDGPHIMFANARHRLLIVNVRVRKRSFLNEERWKTIPWRGRVKTPNDTLLDIFAGIPEALENVNCFGELSSGSPQGQAKDLETRAKCWTLHFQLQAWIAQNESEIYTPTTHTATPLIFPSLEIACLTIRYWVAALLLYSALDTAIGIPPTETQCTHPDRPHPRHFARLIARSAQYFFQEELGITGMIAVSFPLGNALFYFFRNTVFDGEYMALIQREWSNPNLPSVIKEFLSSLKVARV